MLPDHRSLAAVCLITPHAGLFAMQEMRVSLPCKRLGSTALLSDLATGGCRRRRCHTNNDTATPTLWLAAAISMAGIQSSAPCSDLP
jgi:hypothetical protein